MRQSRLWLPQYSQILILLHIGKSLLLYVPATRSISTGRSHLWQRRALRNCLCTLKLARVPIFGWDSFTYQGLSEAKTGEKVSSQHVHLEERMFI